MRIVSFELWRVYLLRRNLHKTISAITSILILRSSGSFDSLFLAAEISPGEARALVDVDVAAVALPRVRTLAEESATQR